MKESHLRCNANGVACGVQCPVNNWPTERLDSQSPADKPSEQEIINYLNDCVEAQSDAWPLTKVQISKSVVDDIVTLLSARSAVVASTGYSEPKPSPLPPDAEEAMRELADVDRALADLGVWPASIDHTDERGKPVTDKLTRAGTIILHLQRAPQSASEASAPSVAEICEMLTPQRTWEDGVDAAADYCVNVLAANHPHLAHAFRHAAVNIRAFAGTRMGDATTLDGIAMNATDAATDRNIDRG